MGIIEKQNLEDIRGFDFLASSIGLNNPETLPEEPLTLHRRGHWFEPSIAHHFVALCFAPLFSFWLCSYAFSNLHFVVPHVTHLQLLIL